MPLNNKTSVDPDGMAHYGRTLGDGLPDDVSKTLDKLLSVLAANEQPEADDPASKQFLEGYRPGRDIVVKFLETLSAALKDAHLRLKETEQHFVESEEVNTKASRALTARVSKVR
ncbi:hypothetical protein ACFWBV_30795 [Streptomyces sp. NPDC060030]|uniref:hypothetical protein n=1 Tax=Streptomyces sp. NPDC060030 TaxID=3347042 RepID=UPI0036A0FABA